jgi:hypothetical protein
MTGNDVDEKSLFPGFWTHESVLSEGLRPSDSPTRSLARRFAGALRFRLR